VAVLEASRVLPPPDSLARLDELPPVEFEVSFPPVAGKKAVGSGHKKKAMRHTGQHAAKKEKKGHEAHGSAHAATRKLFSNDTQGCGTSTGSYAYAHR